MIIQRHLQSEKKSIMQKFQDNGMEFKPIYKKDTTRDNDDLLKPIQRPKHVEDLNGQQNQSLKERTERNLWRNEEVMEMLYIMQQVKALEKLNDKTVKSENVFKDVEEIMHKNGFVKKSHVQIWTKWKFLKSTYMTSRRNGVIPRIIAPQVFKMIHEMITNHNQNLADSCSSLDGDNSSASGMVISGVEGGVTNEDEEEDSFGMAHPIFGFRLGMVKPEPEDTGYEPNDDISSSKDPLDEELSNAKSNNEVKEEHNGVEMNTNKDAQLMQKIIEIPHRGRGRPPKNPPAATSTPNNSSTPAAMPPLRVAPFAKTSIYTNNNVASRPPPPLTMPPSPRIRVANFSNLKDTNTVKFTQPKLTPKPAQEEPSPAAQTVRVIKEATMQTRSSSTPSPSYPKMKQIPMRKTPYSLRPDRAIPDLDVSLSPPPSGGERLASKKLEEVPTTKHLIMQSGANNFQNTTNRRRRIDWQDPIVTKMPKYDSSLAEEADNSKPLNNEYDKNYGKVLQNVIIDLSSSLRKMQTGMMRDFFNKQNDLLEREHKFQMQQDGLILKAFQEQTQEIMQSVRQLVGSIQSQTNSLHNKRNAANRRKSQQNKNKRLQQMQERQQDNEENELADEEEQAQNQEEDTEAEPDTEDMYTDDEQTREQDENEEEEETEEQQDADDDRLQLSGPPTENKVSANKTRDPK